MRYVIIRDDDTNALTPFEYIERLYRPFLDRGLPVNLAVIPDVDTTTTLPDGRPEGFLSAAERTPARTVPIGRNSKLVEYLLANPQFEVVQHGCHHDYFEFDRPSPVEISTRLEQGTQLLMEAGLPRPQTFVAPYDKLSRAGLREVSKRFRVFSTGWFELRRLPASWWPAYASKKLRHAPHWRVNGTTLLSHPGCLLSYHRPYDAMLDTIVRSVSAARITVLVTHWWEYFRDSEPDERFIHVLHETAKYLAAASDIRVIRFSDLASRRVKIN